MYRISKNCSECGKAFSHDARTKGKELCSPACKLARRKKADFKYRQARLARGCCNDCTAPPRPGSSLCAKHARKSTIRRHKLGISKTYYLGSKLSPERNKFLINCVRGENEILRKNWKEVGSWIEANAELWREEPGILGKYVPIYSWDASFIKDRLAEAWLERNNGVSLEDFVIEKIDRERERVQMAFLLEAKIA